MPDLRIKYFDGRSETFSITEDSLSIGRTRENQIVFEDDWVSRNHARITKHNDEYILLDLGSHNGTYLRGSRIDKSSLKHGDVIQIGRSSLTFISDEPKEIKAETVTSAQLSEDHLRHTLQHSRQDTGFLGFIRGIPLFSTYSDSDIDELMKTAEPKSVRAGELVFDQGDDADRFFIVYKGKIRIVQAGEGKKDINLGIRTRQDHFGESAIITGGPRDTAARAVEDSILISISGEAFNDFLIDKPRLREYFDRVIKHLTVHRFLKSFTDLAAASPKDLQELAGKFKSEFFNEGEAVFRQGSDPDRVYLVESGVLRVIRWEDKKPKTINILRKGDFIGDKAIMEGTSHPADVICVSGCQLLSLSREEFSAITQKSPKIKKVVEERLKAKPAKRPSAGFTEVIKQELAALKPIQVERGGPEEDKAKKEKKRFKKLSSFYRKHVRFPFIEQYDEMTCGTTCIMMIAKYYGKTFSSSRLRELAHVDLSGASMANLASAAEQLGFSSRGLKLDYDSLKTVILPCIIHWQGFHYIVVYQINDKSIWVADPAIGLRKYKRDYFVDNWNGITLVIEPSVKLEKAKEDKSSFKNFFQFVLPYKKLYLEVFLASLLLNLFGLASPIFTQNIVDKVLTHQNVSMLNLMLIGMLIVLVFRILTSIVRQYLVIHTGMKIDLRMLVQFYKHLLSLPIGYFKRRKVGDFIARFGENIKIRNFLTETALTIVLDTILIVVYLGLMLYYNKTLTLFVLLFIPLFVSITLIFTPILKKLNIQSFSARAESQSHQIESIHGIDTIKATNTEYQTRWKWEDKFIKSLNVDFKLYNTAIYFNSMGDFVGTLSTTFILWYGAHTVMKGEMTVGALMAFMALMGSVISPINRIIQSWDEIQEAMVSVDRLNDVFTSVPELPEGDDKDVGIILRDPQGEIEFDNVFFRYGGEDDPYILSNIGLKIEQGQKLAIVGRSGSGKTTLAKLIARFYDVTEGKIKIDGQDIKQLNLSNLRHMIGFVLQEDFIFNATIRENISLNDPGETMEKIVRAAKLANAHEFISNMVSGYDTRVGESGLQLSGGQRQRLTIARVLYADPKIIIFDEATSALDTESEQAIQKNMDEILKDRTAIIIAHRMSTVRSADVIIVLDNGEIVEKGSHEELMDLGGLYHYLNYQQLNL